MSECKGKVRHATMGSADFHAASLADRNGGVRPNVYMCPTCGAYHVGYTKQQRDKFKKKVRRVYMSKKAKRPA
jgi:hypothetical protein